MAKKYKPVPKKKSAKGKKNKTAPEKTAKVEESIPKKVVSTTSVSSTPRKRKTRTKKTEVEVLPFGRMNYILLIVGIVIIGLGFFLLSLDDFVDATEFSISLYIAPIVIVGGFIEIIYAIMYKDKSQPVPATTEA